HSALRVEFPPQRPGQVADKFELSALARFLYRNKRLAGGGCSHQRTILHARFPDTQGKYREFSRFRTFVGSVSRSNHPYRLAFLTEFPKQPNREDIRRNRELIRPNREFSFGIR